MGQGAQQVLALADLINGFEQAYTRWDLARVQTDPIVAFHALFESLAWTYTVDDFLYERDGAFAQLPELRGLRFARNRVHHQWADALWLDPKGATFPLEFPIAFFEWRWRDTRDLPTGRASPDEFVYKQQLARTPARHSLNAVLHFFRTL